MARSYQDATVATLRALPFADRVRAVELLGLQPALCAGCGEYIGSPACACGRAPAPTEDAAVDDVDQPEAPEASEVQDEVQGAEVEAPEQEEGPNAREGEQDGEGAPEGAPEPIGTCEQCGEAIYAETAAEHDCTGAVPDAE